ncbi:hypothetical protein ACO1D0_00585, partial [Bacillus licheniformis]|uniref:hypothetical protein n=1 Tax=Bacillus licheniformis TaxID=1402 RepID=UPI003BF74755
GRLEKFFFFSGGWRLAGWQATRLRLLAVTRLRHGRLETDDDELNWQIKLRLAGGRLRLAGDDEAETL